MRATPPYDLDAFLARHVPIAAAMGVRLRSYDDDGLALAAPLAPNVNDKGIAFGGSIASLLSLAGWALTDFTLREAGVAADVVVASVQLTFLRPVRGEIVASCRRPVGAEVARFLDDWGRRGRARWTLRGSVGAGEAEAALFRADYVAVPRPPSA